MIKERWDYRVFMDLKGIKVRMDPKDRLDHRGTLANKAQLVQKDLMGPKDLLAPLDKRVTKVYKAFQELQEQ